MNERPKKLPFELILIGMVFAMVGEIFDNVIINHRHSLIFAIIVPIYLLFFILIYAVVFKKIKMSAFTFSLLSGIFAWIIIENIILKKFSEPWPIQIFMLSYWVSIISYPLILVQKKYKVLIIALLFALAISISSYLIRPDQYLNLAIFQFSFWIFSAILILINLGKAS